MGTSCFPAAPEFRFGSLDFIADQLGTLPLREEIAAPAAPEGGAPPTGSQGDTHVLTPFFGMCQSDERAADEEMGQR
jgi:hypothetical protein